MVPSRQSTSSRRTTPPRSTRATSISGPAVPSRSPTQYFGTAAIPHLAVEVGKEGYVYLLNRDNLGGMEEGPDGADDVVGRYGPNGGVWSSPARLAR